MNDPIVAGSPEDRLRSYLLHTEDADPLWRMRVSGWRKRVLRRLFVARRTAA